MLPPSLRHRSSRRLPAVRLVVFAVVGAAAVAACSSGESALEIDSDGATTTIAPDGTSDTATDDSRPDETALASTTTVAPLAQFPDCPTGALESAAGPVEITFWHGMNDVLEDSLIALTDAYNASQDKVTVTLQNQTGSSSPSTRCSRSRSRTR
jgi:ABC-type glycerol-3-phosphate transport system substrate-binding protein